ncbi:MAG: MltA domain-containing protein [Desulfocapsa sp.]|nr:MltA domain-containing protein [Desulfocapsa sp.]
MQRLSSPFLLLATLFLLLHGCAKASLDKVGDNDLPSFTDEMGLDNLLTGAVRHLHYLNKLPNDSSFTLGSDTYPVSWMRESMDSFIDILKQDPNPEELARIVRENYTVYQAGGRKDSPKGEMLITGYYEPLLLGSLTKEGDFLYPLYSPPPTLIQIQDPSSGKTLFKRKNNKGQLVPYWTRKEIKEKNIAAGNELVYLDNPVDAFILQVQGSGKIQLTDGSIRSIHYAASNGLEYFSIGKLLVDQGKMTLEEASIPSIRKYLREHPDEEEEILNHNIKFIFFHWATETSPLGSLGEPLTAGRSLAVDPDVLPQEALAFLVSRKPVLNDAGDITAWVPMQRFVFPQDSGSAILGSGRADLFWGNGDYARKAAGSMKEKGTLYFLVKNSFEEQEK